MTKRVPLSLIREITATPVAGMSEHDRDEMAIPSYLHGNPLIRWLMWRRYEVIAELAKFNRRMQVLEFGCGPGLFLPELHHSCGQVYAMDLFPEYAGELARNCGLSVTFIDQLEALENHSLDLIVAADVLEHVEDTSGYLHAFAQKIKPGGRLIISGPTENIAYRLGRILAGFGGKGDYHHTNIDHLIRQIEVAGFHAGRKRNLPFIFPPWLFRVCEFHHPAGPDR